MTAIVTFSTRTNRAMLREPIGLGMVIELYDLDWQLHLKRTLGAMNYRRVDDWKQSGHNFTANFANRRMNELLGE